MKSFLVTLFLCVHWTTIHAQTIKYHDITEPDVIVEAHDTYSYALDRINQKRLPLDSKYYSGQFSGKGVDVYVIDTGINVNDHYSFQCGYSFIGNTSDCSSGSTHGSVVGSLIGSKSFGLAYNANIISLKVLDSYGRGYLSTVINSLDYLLNKNVTCSIINMSIGSQYSEIMNMKIQELVLSNNQVVVSAGNAGKDACDYSPSSSEYAITVGSINREDTVSSFSNTGKCVTLYSPGERILGATGNGLKSRLMSGTSASAPLVSGALALRIEHKGCSAQVRSKGRRDKRIVFVGKK